MKAIAIPGKVPATQEWIAEVAHALHVPALDLQVHSRRRRSICRPS